MIPGHLPSLSAEARTALGRLAEVPALADMYLAGSAALALYLAHRPVASLDWMTASNRLRAAERRDLLEQLLAVDPATRVETARDGYLFVRDGADVALKFFYYPYPLIEPEETSAGVWVASALDLALMKLGAIISRGTKRDFIDFYLLTRALPLEAILDRSSDKFGHVSDFPLQALKGLADTSLTVGEPMPRLNGDLDWPVVAARLASEARAAARARLGIDRLDAAE